MVRFLTKLSPFPFYTYIKQIFEHHESSTGPPKVRLLECVALCLFILRFAALQLALNYHQTSRLSWDPLAQYFYHYRHIYAGYILLCLALLGVFALLTNWLYFLKTWENTSLSKTKSNNSALSWPAIAYDLIVRNVDQAQRCTTKSLNSDRSTRVLNQNINKPFFKYSPHHRFNSFRKFLTDRISLKHLDLGKLSRSEHQLTIFSFLSVSHRKKVLQYHRFSSVSTRLFQWISLDPILLGLSAQLILGVPAAFPGPLPLFGWLLLLNDILLICTFGWLFFRNVLFIVYIEQVHSLVYRWHLQAIHRLLNYLSRKYRSTSTGRLNLWERLLLNKFLTEHAHICALLDGTNRQLTSQAAFFSLLCNCPTNIYFIYRLIYQKILISEFGVTIIFTACQIICHSCAFVPLAQANGALYRTGKYLPAIQLYVLRGGSNRPLKMKYEILQSTLTESRVKSGATIGPVCLITFESLYKVITLYAVYMLAFFDLLPK